MEQITEKSCTKCCSVKAVSEFGKDSDKKDGYSTICKPCRKIAQRAYAQTYQYKQARKARDLRYGQSEKGKANYKKYQESDKGIVTVKRYRTSDKGLLTKREYLNEYKKQYPQIERAHEILNRYVRRGKIIRPNVCSKCLKEKRRIEGHHPDYNKPLEVVWLCRGCHRKEPTGIV
jgi:hypothetical protein